MAVIPERWQLICLLWFSACSISFAQYDFQYIQHVPVFSNGDSLALPWAGGLNAGVYNTLDLNQDQVEDLVVLDRTSGRLLTFANDGKKYHAEPALASFLPEIRNWMLLLDYNGDGKKDLFTGSGSQGISVYQNITDEEGVPQWKLLASPLKTLGFSGFIISLQVGHADVPGIADTDGDGDLDIVVYNVNGRGNLEYYQNLSMEQYGHSDSLLFEARERRWGGVKECDCNAFVFGTQECETPAARREEQNREQHIGGKSILLIDTDGDQDKDLLVGHEECTELYFLENVGSRANPRFESFSSRFPGHTRPADFYIYPSAFYEDLDLDGVRDLVVAPNTGYNVSDSIDFTASSWLYKNMQTDESPSFSFVTQSFLQEEMIDVGENAVPALADYDQDGDMDLFIGSRGRLQEGEFSAGITLYENTGSHVEPVFTLRTTDFAGIRQLGLQELKIYFADLGRDGLPELILAGAYQGKASLYVLENRAIHPFQFEAINARKLSFDFGIKDNFTFYDVNNDGEQDLLLGKQNGNLSYFRNTGKGLNPHWVLEEEKAGGIEAGMYRLFLSPLLYDLDRNGNPELLTTDISGKLLVYTDFLGQLQQKQAAAVDTAGLTYEAYNHLLLKLGQQTWLAAADLFADHQAVLLVGMREGGIALLKTGPKENSFQKNSLLVFPNPSAGDVRVRADNDMLLLQVLSLHGQIILEKKLEIPAVQTEVSMQKLSAGIYLLRAYFADGSMQTGKLIVPD